MLLRTRIAGLGLAALFVAAVPAQAQTTLRYKFKQGDKLDYVIENKMTMKIDLGGKEIEMAINQNMEMAWKVESVANDGKARIQQKLMRIQFSMDTPMGKIEYDSKDGKAPPGPIGETIAPVFKALSGLEFTLTMDPRGEISDVKVPKDLLKAVNAQQLPGVGEMFTEDGLKKMMAQSGISFPKDAVTKGKTWNQKLGFKMPFGEMKMDNVYTYEGTVQKGDRKVEQVSLKPTISLKPDENAPVAMTMKDGGGKGTAYFDNDAGKLVEMSMVQNMVMEAAGQTIRMVQNVSMKLKQ
jgi:Family of unknown function (DUF6263)